MTSVASGAHDLLAGLPIHEVSRVLGVPAPTLRSWERRYGVPRTPRSVGGHRRYSLESVTELRLMRDEIARGQRAASAARSVRLLLDQRGPAADRVAELLSASEQLDPDGISAVLDRALQDMGLAATIDAVLLPGMRQVGMWWETGRCDVGQEHLTTRVARGWLSRQTATAPVAAHTESMVLACGPRDLHTLGLEALVSLLSHLGYRCHVLGAQTPMDALVTAVTATSAAGVVVVSHMPSQRLAAVEAIRAAAMTGCLVFYAGNAFHVPRARKGVPGRYLGQSLPDAAALIATALKHGTDLPEHSHAERTAGR